MLYVLEWLHHSFFGDGTIAGLFDMNMLHPHKNVLAWSEAMLGAVPIYSLVRGSSGNPVLGLNLTAFAAVFASCVGLARLGRLLTGRPRSSRRSSAALAWSSPAKRAISAESDRRRRCGWCSFSASSPSIQGPLHARRSSRSSVGSLVLRLFAIMFLLFAVSMYGGALILHRAATLAWTKVASDFPVAVGHRHDCRRGLQCLWLAVHYRAVQADIGDYSPNVFITYVARITSFFDVHEGGSS